MKLHDYKAAWLDILRAQDEKLRMEALTAEDALQIGLIMVRLAKEKYGQPVSVRIITNGHATFEYYMEGTDSYNRWWMDKKLNTSRASGVSSIRTMVELGEGLRQPIPEFDVGNNFALCGGCVPVRTPQGRLLGYAQSSGMRHEQDHQLIIDALSEYLGIEVPSLLK